jgi:hypothetical protein
MQETDSQLGKPSYWQLIFLQSKVNGAPYNGEALPGQSWDWPKDTYFQRRLHLIKILEPAEGSKSISLIAFPVALRQSFHGNSRSTGAAGTTVARFIFLHPSMMPASLAHILRFANTPRVIRREMRSSMSLPGWRFIADSFNNKRENRVIR